MLFGARTNIINMKTRTVVNSKNSMTIEFKAGKAGLILLLIILNLFIYPFIRHTIGTFILLYPSVISWLIIPILIIVIYLEWRLIIIEFFYRKVIDIDSTNQMLSAMEFYTRFNGTKISDKFYFDEIEKLEIRDNSLLKTSVKPLIRVLGAILKPDGEFFELIGFKDLQNACKVKDDIEKRVIYPF
ncbi:MAG: hypothetical protein ACTSRA_10025 [Promethearchaeota archaeon]